MTFVQSVETRDKYWRVYEVDKPQVTRERLPPGTVVQAWHDDFHMTVNFTLLVGPRHNYIMREKLCPSWMSIEAVHCVGFRDGQLVSGFYRREDLRVVKLP